MATLAAGGRITAESVDEEIARLRALWRRAAEPATPAPSARPDQDGVLEVLGAEAAADLDPFDRIQLAEVIRVCRSSRSLSEAGRALFSASRAKKNSVNDADRLRKYLARFGLSFPALVAE
jgi:transcriptional regulatory protein RtcR